MKDGGRRAFALMAKAPAFADVKTRLAARLDAEQRVRLASAFIVDKAEQLLGIPDSETFVAFWPPEAESAMRALVGPAATLLVQTGDGLGERLCAVANELFARGFDRVVIVDADTPNLPRARLFEALAELESGSELVLGPAWDGGYYLIGLRRPVAALFDNITWSTSAVLSQTVDAAVRAGVEPAFLPAWYDVDTPRDLDRLVRHLADDADVNPTPKATRAALAAFSPQTGAAPRGFHWQTLSGRTMYENPWIRVDEHVVRVAENGHLTLYGVVSCPRCVGVLALTDDDHVVLLRQFRYVEQRHTLEIPTGAVHEGESLVDAAQRELREEVGRVAKSMSALTRFRTNKSVLDEEAAIFLARGLSHSPLTPDPTEHIEVVLMSFQDALALVRSGEITDSMTIVALLWLAPSPEERAG